MSDKLAKYIFLASISIACLGGAFLYGVIAQRDNLPPVPQMIDAKNLLRDGVPKYPSDILAHLQPNRGQGAGIIRNDVNDDHLVMLSGFFDGENQVRIVERDGSVVHKWSLDYSEHFPRSDTSICVPKTPLEVDVHGVVVTPKSELVFNYEYCGAVKLDSCGRKLWSIEDRTHHSVVRAEAGGYWFLGRWAWTSGDEPDRFPPFSRPGDKKIMLEDTLLRVAEDGGIIEEVSIPEIMRDGGLFPLLTASGDTFEFRSGRDELVHANKVAELPSELAAAYPLFEAGDLAISMRELNLLLVLDPVTKEIKWHQVGPWLRLHDPEFRPDGRISIFNNNVFLDAYKKKQTVLSTPFDTNIMLIDPVTRDFEIVFGGKPGQEMLSVIRGQHELLPEDGKLIVEFDAGRVIEIDAAREIVWEYVNEYDEDFVGEIINANVYPRSYFETLPGTETCS